MDPYFVTMTVFGLAILGAAWIPRLLEEQPLSMPILYVGIGAGVYLLPVELAPADPIAESQIAEHLAEIGVIVALTGAGLKLGRRLGWHNWASTWRLLGITMLVCIGAVVVAGRFGLGLGWASAMLLAAVLAPTDPVLAADVEAEPPGAAQGEVRFALTSEAGLNDSLAFPFTNAAIAMATFGAAPGRWIGEWLVVDVVWKLGGGVAAGLVLGWFFARIVLSETAESRLGQTSTGLMALAMTFVTYGLCELIEVYGFLAVFVVATTVRHYETDHAHHESLHDFAEQIERLLVVALLVLFGGSLASGLLGPLTWPAAFFGLGYVFVIRPAAGAVGLLGTDLPGAERGVISFFGIRGIGSFFYLAHGLNEGQFPEGGYLWATAGFVVVVSILVHGVSAGPAIQWMKRREAG